MTKKTLTFLGILSLLALRCAPDGAGDPQVQLSSLSGSHDPSDGPSGGPCGCKELPSLVGTWTVTNYGMGTTGQVTFKSDHTYTVDSGTYNAGGTWAGKSSGTYKTLPGGAIAFTYDSSASVNRIAVGQCLSKDQIVHFVMGHTHDYEQLDRTAP